VESDEHLDSVHYLERDPFRANLVEWAQDWRWSSLGRCTQGDDKVRQLPAAWPIHRPKNWVSLVNRAWQEGAESGSPQRSADSPTAERYGANESSRLWG